MQGISGVWAPGRRCEGNATYRNLTIAAENAQIASEKSGHLIIAYKCYDCGSFHIGHADKSQKIVNEKRETKKERRRRLQSIAKGSSQLALDKLCV